MSTAIDNPASLTARIRREARRLGFFKTGVARASQLPHADRFDQWLSAGMHAEMMYMERQAERRKDPSLVLQGVRSILVLGMNYHFEDGGTNDPLKGEISRYARGDDYHILMSARLAALSRFIADQAPGVGSLWYVDIGPVMEKVWGAHSSLGWMGKHSSLVTREAGSWFFTGVLLLDIELEYDAPAKDYCGTCTRCIEACPTKAIVGPYVVDARLCISYLTIEHRGFIPRSLRPLIGSRIFGCDCCQEVCPWNRFAKPSGESAFVPRHGHCAPDLEALAGLTPRTFAALFKHSPILRAKRDGFVRNVMVALGNSGRPETAETLETRLKDESPLVRGHAAWGLARVAGAAAAKALSEAYWKEADPAAREEIDLSLRELRQKSAP